MELKYTVQNYAWGKKGNDSMVARLLKNAYPETNIIDDKCYAELWLGTHPNGPSIIKSNDTELLNLIKQHPEYLGEKCLEQFGNDIPYLFKVLSIREALSIQVHPNKEMAKELHAKQPDIYKDPNHKPEIAIALTPFKALCGFRPIQEIKMFLKDIPELNAVIEKKKVEILLQSPDDCYEEPLKDCFHSLMTCSTEVIGQAITSLLQRLDTAEDSCKYLYGLLKELNGQFPNDVGCFCIYFLNLINLERFESIFLGANIPHAYISGDCIECMACSDNVVRAGLTPKFKDVKTLCAMLNYRGHTACEMKFTPLIENDYKKLYKPPVPDFSVALIQIPESLKRYKLDKRNSASILLVVEGDGSIDDLHLKSGVAVFIPANEEMEILIKESLLLFQAFANV